MKTDYPRLDEAIALYEGGMAIKQVSTLTEIPSTSLHRILKHMNISRSYKTVSRKYTVNDSYFDSIDTEDKAYWLGFFYADGFVSKAGKYNQKNIGVSLSIKDREHLYKLKESLGATNPVKDYDTVSYGKPIAYSRLLITSDQLHDSLIEKGAVEHKTLILSFPTPDIVPSDLLYHFIRGYFDGDGSLAKNGVGGFTFKLCGTREMLEGVCEALGLGERKLYQRNVSTKNNYSVEIGGRLQVLSLMDKLYDGATIYLQRKYDRYQQLNTQSHVSVM